MNGFKPRPWRFAIAASVVTALVTAGIAIAVVPGRTIAAGGPITAVKVARGDSATTTSSTTYVNVPGASRRITVPGGQHALILARFSAESECSTGPPGSTCSVRILIGGSEGKPASGLDFAFDSVGTGPTDDASESHSMDRSRVLGAGTWAVRVQYAVSTAATTFRLDDWSLTVERSKR
jgi:hypothetical protein